MHDFHARSRASRPSRNQLRESSPTPSQVIRTNLTTCTLPGSPRFVRFCKPPARSDDLGNGSSAQRVERQVLSDPLAAADRRRAEIGATSSVSNGAASASARSRSRSTRGGVQMVSDRSARRQTPEVSRRSDSREPALCAEAPLDGPRGPPLFNPDSLESQGPNVVKRGAVGNRKAQDVWLQPDRA